MTRVIDLSRHEEIVKGAQLAYKNHGSGVVRVAHKLITRVNSKGVVYCEDAVTHRKVSFEKSVISRSKDHAENVERRINRLLVKEREVGLSRTDVNVLVHLSLDSVVEADYNLSKRIETVLEDYRYL